MTLLFCASNVSKACSAYCVTASICRYNMQSKTTAYWMQGRIQILPVAVEFAVIQNATQDLQELNAGFGTVVMQLYTILQLSQL